MHQQFEYRTTYAPVAEDFPDHESLDTALSKLSPKPPHAGDWRLVCSAPVTTLKGSFIVYSWERPVTSQRTRVHHR